MARHRDRARGTEASRRRTARHRALRPDARPRRAGRPNDNVLRPAILWNDQRTGAECDEIEATDRPRSADRAHRQPRAAPASPRRRCSGCAAHEPDVYARIRSIAAAQGLRPAAADRRARHRRLRRLGDAAPRRRRAPLERRGPRPRSSIDAETGCPKRSRARRSPGTRETECRSRPAPATRPPARSASGSTDPGPLSVVLGTSGVVFAALDSFAADPQARVHAFCHARAGRLARDGRDAVGRRLARLAARRRSPRSVATTSCWRGRRVAAGRRGSDLPPLPRRASGRPTPTRTRAARSPASSLRHDRGALIEGGARGRGVRAARLPRPDRASSAARRGRARLRRRRAQRAVAADRRQRARAAARARRRRRGRGVRRGDPRRRRRRRLGGRRRRRRGDRADRRPDRAVDAWIEPYREARERYRALYPALAAATDEVGPGTGRTPRPRLPGLRPGGISPSTWPPKPPPTIRAPSAPARSQPRHRRLDRRRRDLVAVAQARVRRVEQLAELRQVAGRERGDRLLDPRVLGDHVAGAGIERLGQLGRHRERHVSQAVARRAARTPRRTPRGARCRPERRVRVGVTLAGVERDQQVIAERERDRAHLERAEVDPQRALGLAEQRGDLVEQAGLCADPVVLDPRAELRQLDPVGRPAPASASSASTSATSSAAEDDSPAPRGTVPRISSRADERRTRRPAAPPAAPRTNARQPRTGSRRSRAKGRAVQVAANASIRSRSARLRPHRDALVDRERQRETLVVVGVLADQVHPSGGKRDHLVTHPVLSRA